MSIRADFGMTDADRIFAGEDRILEFTVYTTNAKTTAQVITGWALEWALRVDPSDAAATLTKTTAAGITITDGTGGVCQVAIADTDTVSLNPGDYHHALRRTDAGAEVVLTFGVFRLLQAAVR